jgi:p21-activated kinase 1
MSSSEYQQRPSRESIQEYHALLADANAHAAQHNFIPHRQPPPPPNKLRNSLQKPNPRTRKLSLPSSSSSPDPFASQPMAAGSPPPRPSRANTATLTDVFLPTDQAIRRLSTPVVPNHDGAFYADPQEQLPPPPQEYAQSTIRSRSGTTSSKGKKSVLGSLGFIFNTQKRPEISTPYDPVHLTHVGFNTSTGEFTGLPKEWQQLLQESGISRSDQEKNPQAVMEIVKFYQEGQAEGWDKLGAMGAFEPPDDGFQNPVSPL